MIKKQGLKLKFKPLAHDGWAGWIRTNECRYQKPVPYHLATAQYVVFEVWIYFKTSTF